MRTCTFLNDFDHPEVEMHFHVHSQNYSEWHNHDYWEFFIVLSGTVDHNTENAKQPLKSGMAYLVHPTDKHNFRNCSKGYQQYNFAITDECFRELLSFIDPTLYESLVSFKSPIPYLLNENMLEILHESVHIIQTVGQNKESYKNLMKLIWLDIIKVVYFNHIDASHNYPDWLNDFIATLHRHENIATPVQELSHLTFFSYRHLTRLFKQYTGKTLNEYMLQIRMNYAASLLRSTDMGILEISSHLGYDSLSHFIKMFRRYFNISPKKYRTSFEAAIKNKVD